MQIGSGNTVTFNTAAGGTGLAASGSNASVVTIDVTNTAGTVSHGKIASGTGTNALAAAAGALTVNYSSSATAYTANNTLLANVITGTGGMTWNPGTAFASIGTATAVATGSTTTTSGTGNTLTDNSYTLAFTAYRDATTATSLDILVTRANTYQSSSSLENQQNIGRALEAAGTAGTGDTNLKTIQGTLDSYSTAGQVANALVTLTPTTQSSGQTTQAVVATQDASISTVENRMELARAEMSGTGIATGGKMNNSGVWGQVFGTSVDQGWRKGVDGFQADVWGGTLGADTAISNQTRVGVSLGYGNTSADGTGNETDVNSYQIAAYGTYDMGKLYYEGLGSFSYNQYETNRTLFTGSRANGDFDGQQYSLKAGVGYKVDVQGGLKFTPFASLQYTFITQDDYTETGSTANLHVKTDDLNILKTGLGAKVAYPIVDGGVTYNPRLSAGWYFDLVGDEVETTSNFTAAASNTFISKGADVAQSAFKLGAGLDVMAQDNVTVSLDYNWESRESYDAHTGQVKARFEF